MKRIIIAHDAGGKSVFASDGEPPKGAAMAGGGLEITQVWGTEDVPTLPSAYGDPLNGASIPLFARTNARKVSSNPRT